MATHFYYDGHTYEIEVAPLNWAAANQNAASLTWNETRFGLSVDAYLTKVDSSTENATILKNLKQSIVASAENIKAGSDAQYAATRATDGGNASYLWLGGSDATQEGAWTWGDGSSLSAGYQNWGSGSLGSEPDNFNGNQNFLAIATEKWPAPQGGLGNAGQWNDLNGDNLLLSIVEWDGLLGTDGNDKLTGTSRDDIIDGRAGNDVIKAGAGNDLIYLGDGNDKLDAGSGDNIVTGETGGIDSDDGDDSITAGSGNDFIASGTGNDIINAGNGSNLVIGGSGNDKITTGSGDDIIDKNVFPDGSSQYYADEKVAAEGNDIIKTGSGNDTIYLGEGIDRVWGGSGDDLFILDAITTDSSLTISSSGASSGPSFSLGAGSSSSSSSSGGISMGNGSSSSSTSKSNVLKAHTIYDFNAGSSKDTVVDKIVFDAEVFTALNTENLPDGLQSVNFLIGKGFTQPSPNETGVDDYLIFDTKTGNLYYDADGNGTEENTILVATLKGQLGNFGLEDIAIINA